MALDEAILEAVQQRRASPTLRLYSWYPPCLSIGYAQSVKDADLAEIESLGWDLVRRPTGGKAILHTDELTYSIAAPIDHAIFANGVLSSYQRISRGLTAGLERIGLKPETHLAESPTTQDSNPVCFQNPGAFEITVDGKKLVGSAQLRRAGGVLQHGSLPIHGDISRICLGLDYPSSEARHQARLDVGEQAVTIEQALDEQYSWDEVAENLIAGFEEALRMRFTIEEPSEEETLRSQVFVRDQYSNSDWTSRI